MDEHRGHIGSRGTDGQKMGLRPSSTERSAKRLPGIRTGCASIPFICQPERLVRKLARSAAHRFQPSASSRMESAWALNPRPKQNMTFADIVPSVVNRVLRQTLATLARPSAMHNRSLCVAPSIHPGRHHLRQLAFAQRDQHARSAQTIRLSNLPDTEAYRPDIAQNPTECRAGFDARLPGRDEGGGPPGPALLSRLALFRAGPGWIEAVQAGWSSCAPMVPEASDPGEARLVLGQAEQYGSIAQFSERAHEVSQQVHRSDGAIRSLDDRARHFARAG